MDEIPASLRQFIFDYIDSVEQLEVLLFLRMHQNQWFTVDAISAEFRSSPQSIESRLKALQNSKLVQIENSTPAKPKYCYSAIAEFDAIIEELGVTYRLRRQTVLEFIFSPLKRGRQFAEAFIIKKTKTDGDSNG